HLATRPDELEALVDPALKAAAPQLDVVLRQTRFQTLVHGDAKTANFCFARDGVAAVDFQYVGGGCGMKDVAYLLSECLSPAECAAASEQHLDCYFRHLRIALRERGRGVDAAAVEAEWRPL